MDEFSRNSWKAHWGFHSQNIPVNPYDGGTPTNDPFPYTSDIEGGWPYSVYPVFAINGGAP